jgi:methylglutaconyl-CoA hydratase
MKDERQEVRLDDFLTVRKKISLVHAMILLRSRPTLYVRQIQSCFYSTALAPVIKVTSVPAPHCGSIRILSLNRPAARNAISRQLLAELNHQIDSIHNEGETGATRALILSSEVDSSFCAGADLKERAGFTPEEYIHPNSIPRCGLTLT